MPLVASCQCGIIRLPLPLDQPTELYICHCTHCQAQSAAAFGISACFPTFAIPPPGSPPATAANLGSWVRTTASGEIQECWFCTVCGTRLVHAPKGAEFLVVKGGSIRVIDDEHDDTGNDGKKLDIKSVWDTGMHIWCRSAVVSIPDTAERWEKDDGTSKKL
ncbi:hypothetical protein EV356DRAFT_363755 [Viridothelium virens]|uniref:CENP-V/GFA domain-containing protein n=1 Tax=Viridothelium virens TaxID=1048519 RepID=A0A6A6HIZ8_VIRVR|nr:hypothetical protein EV356DRAFT_363755 [Viridothelium virens]